MFAAAQGGQNLRALQSGRSKPNGAGQCEHRERDQLQPVRECSEEPGPLHQTDPGHTHRRSAKDLADWDSAGRSADEHARSARLPSDATVEHDKPAAAPNAATASVPFAATFEPDANSISDVQPPITDSEPPITDQPVDGSVADDEPTDDDGSAERTDEPNEQSDGRPDGWPDEQPNAGPATADDAVNAHADEQPDE